MFRISKAAMDTSLERIRAKIIELEAKIADLRIAEREIQALEKSPARKTRPGPGPKPKRKPEASNQAEARQTIGSAIADVLGQQGALSAAETKAVIRDHYGAKLPSLSRSGGVRRLMVERRPGAARHAVPWDPVHSALGQTVPCGIVVAH